MAVALGIPYHDGEIAVQSLMQVPPFHDNPTQPYLTPQAARMLTVGPLIALGTLDQDDNPWTTLWGGTPPLSHPMGQNMIGVRAPISKSDPVVQRLFGSKEGEDEDLMKGGKGLMVSGLTLNLETRKRVKIYGRMVAGAVVEGQAQLVIRVEQSLGNCPKYVNKKAIVPLDEAASSEESKEVLHEEGSLCEDARRLIDRCDLFFISSSNAKQDMDTNHRGGPRGFVRTQVDERGVAAIVWPEYSGNRLYQTLGNLQSSPKAGLVFPDLETGDVLYVTGETQIFAGEQAAKVLPRSNLAVKLTVTQARYVTRGLQFRGVAGEASPYNPRVRALAGEGPVESEARRSNTAKLMSIEKVTPTINRYRFTLEDPVAAWAPGAWVALDLVTEMNMGYSHMRDDDPQSLNDDFVRTFTVSSPPTQEGGLGVAGTGDAEKQGTEYDFEITIRTVGAVTEFLSRQRGGGGLEIGIKGFGGGLPIETSKNSGKKTGFIAGGVGITPLLAQLHKMDLEQMRIFWSIAADDVGLVISTAQQHPTVKKAMRVFVTGAAEGRQKAVDVLKEAGVEDCWPRRLSQDDLLDGSEMGDAWYACVSTGLRTQVLGWLEGKEVLYEDFNF